MLIELSLTDEIVDIEEKIVNQISLINNSDAGLLKIGLDPLPIWNHP